MAMGTGSWRVTKPTSTGAIALDRRLGRVLSSVLLSLGAIFVLSAMTYTAHALLKSWLMDQDRYLMAGDIDPLPLLVRTWPAPPTPTATPKPTNTPLPTATSTTMPLFSSAFSAASTAAPSPTNTLPPSPTPTATPSPSPSPTIMPTSQPGSPPVKIRIPALNVNRSIIELPRSRDRHTGAWTWNTKRLFRSGRKDLVGYSEGSAYPGQEGNMILVGHNYGYGYNGVFVRLGRLKIGGMVYVIDKSGEKHTYRVTEVKRVKWRRKSLGELTLHLSFLATSGSERLTLVSCSGADVEPFPERIYVVAEPSR